MGIVSSLLSQSNNNMKFLLVLAVAAYVKADADPGFAYSVGHLPLAYAHAPLVYTAAHAPPEADPWLYYSGLYGHHGYGYGYNYAPLTYTYAPYTYSHVYGHYGLGHYGYYGRKKRDAEAEPTAD